MGNLRPTEEQLKAARLQAEKVADKLANKAVASKYTTAIFLVVIIVAFCAGASIPLWFD